MNPQELRRTLVLANEHKEGDAAVGGGNDARLREEARQALLALSVGEVTRTPIIDDGVSEALQRTLDRHDAADLERLTLAELRRHLLGNGVGDWVARYRDALSSEVIAAAVKVMTNGELAWLAGALFNPHPGADGDPETVTIGGPGHFGSRIQPNSPGDDEDEILFSTLEGLSYGCGDVVLGLNPASDDVDTIVRLESLLEGIVERLALPTRFCVLSDLLKQDRARARTKVDVGFQSLAGTSSALAGMVGMDVDGLLDVSRGFGGLYFETGQGAEVTNGAAEGVDMVTLESRTYGVARHVGRATGAWMIVNDVAGFIGPEVFRTPEQLERACLEDTVMAKLHGLTMGLDVCATFHMGIPPATLRELTERIVTAAAPAYLMAVAGNADPMLGYLTTSFREHPRLRQSSGRRATTAMVSRLTELGVRFAGDLPDPDAAARLFAVYAKASGDRRAHETLVDEGRRKLAELRERGFDLGCGVGARGAANATQSGSGDGAAEADARVDAIYRHARRALYAAIDDRVIADASPRHVRVATEAVDRDDYLAHPARGERLRAESARASAAVADGRRPQVQLVISDGLNAQAVNEQVGALLPSLRRSLAALGCAPGDVDVVVQNGRVRAGYHVGALTGATTVVHLIGERPGTGLNTLSAYLTYGLDVTGRSRWRTDLDHACTTAICGIHPRGKPVGEAVSEIARTVRRILDVGRSGIDLHRA